MLHLLAFKLCKCADAFPFVPIAMRILEHSGSLTWTGFEHRIDRYDLADKTIKGQWRWM